MSAPAKSETANNLAASLRGLTKTIRTDFWKPATTILTGVDLAVPQGAIVGFVGHNGAGKSTTIKMMIGAARPTQGTVEVLGGSPADANVRRRLGYLPEVPQLPQNLTPRELLKTHAGLAMVKPEARRQRVEDLIDRVRLRASANQRLSTFSKGMQQRVALALALVGEPSLLILDEPMSGLDPAGRRLVREVLLEYRSQDRSVLLSSHVLPDLEALCDEVVIVDRGRTVAAGSLDALLGQEKGATEIIFREGQATADKAALELAQLQLGPVERRGGDWVLVLEQIDGASDGDDDSERVYDAIAQLRASGMTLAAVERKRPHLEEVLLRLVDEHSNVEPSNVEPSNDEPS